MFTEDIALNYHWRCIPPALFHKFKQLAESRSAREGGMDNAEHAARCPEAVSRPEAVTTVEGLPPAEYRVRV